MPDSTAQDGVDILALPRTSTWFTPHLAKRGPEIAAPAHKWDPSSAPCSTAERGLAGPCDVPSGMCVESDLVSADLLDGIFRDLNDIAPFKRGILLHESLAGDVPKSIAYEARRPCALSSGDRLARRTGINLGILKYVGCLDRFSSDSGIFYWRGRTGSSPKLTPVLAEYLDQFNGSQGVAAGICSSTNQAATLIQLEYTADLPNLGKMTTLSSIAAYLHWRLVLFLRESTPCNATAEVKLTSREREVVQWIAAGKTSWETGRIMAISERGIKFHLANIYSKLNVSNRAQAIMAATRLGIV